MDKDKTVEANSRLEELGILANHPGAFWLEDKGDANETLIVSPVFKLAEHGFG